MVRGCIGKYCAKHQYTDFFSAVLSGPKYCEPAGLVRAYTDIPHIRDTASLA